MLLLFVTLALGAAPADAGAAPELARTVERLAGRWTFDITVALAGSKLPVKAKLTWDCKPVAAGRAVSCVGGAKLPELGTLEEASLVGYDPETKAVHMMTVNSMGEFHDHRGAWKDERTLELEV